MTVSLDRQHEPVDEEQVAARRIFGVDPASKLRRFAVLDQGLDRKDQSRVDRRQGMALAVVARECAGL